MVEYYNGSGTIVNYFIGKNFVLGPLVSLGKDPLLSEGKLKIGNNAIIRSHTVIYKGTVIGDNFQTGHGVLIRENNEIGNNVSIGSHTVVERNNKIADNVRIHSMCFIPEFVIIQKNAWIGPHVTITNILHPPCPKFEDCAPGVVIGKNAKIGANVTILPHVIIGKNSLIGAGAVVTKSIPPDVVAVGNPAKVICNIKDLKCEMGYYKIPYEWEEKE